MNCVRKCFVKNISQRCLIHTASVFRSNLKPHEQARVPEEIRIPVPWGHIAGKWWGPKNADPVLAIHGWQDNANSFDPLAELLPIDLPFLAIDLPGNGLSSHLPPFQNYYYVDTVGLIKRLKNYLGLDKLKLIGHSGGSSTCFLFAGIFPEDVHSYFGIDYIVQANLDDDKRVSTLGKNIDKKIDLCLRDHSQSRAYTWEVAKDIWIKATNNSLNEKSCEILMKRGLTKLSGGKYIFSRDHRLKTPDINVYRQGDIRKIAENIQCHVHIVKGLQSPFMQQSLNSCPDILEQIRKNAKSFEYTEFDGKHHLHMDLPELFVKPFLDLINK